MGRRKRLIRESERVRERQRRQRLAKKGITRLADYRMKQIAHAHAVDYRCKECGQVNPIGIHCRGLIRCKKCGKVIIYRE